MRVIPFDREPADGRRCAMQRRRVQRCRGADAERCRDAEAQMQAAEEEIEIVRGRREDSVSRDEMQSRSRSSSSW